MSDKIRHPQGWTSISLGRTGTWYGGGTPSKFDASFWSNGRIPWVSPKDMKSFRITDSEDHVAPVVFERTNLRQFPAGTLLMVIRSGILSRTFPVAVAQVSATMNQDLKGVKPDDGINPTFLAYQLIGREQELLRACSKNGTTVASIDTSRLHGFPIRLAPTREQARIVAKIEELFGDLDAGVAALHRVKANLKRYRAAVLNAAVTGKLTAEWRRQNPPTESAEKLLARILEERRKKWEAEQLSKFAKARKTLPSGWREKYCAPAPVTSGPDGLPLGWCWASAEQIGEVQLGRQRSPNNRSLHYPTKYIRAANITEKGLALDDILEMEFRPHELENYRLRAGDILLSEASGSPDQVGKPAMWGDEIADCCFQNTVIRLRPITVCNRYLLIFFKHCYTNKIFSRIAAGVGINHLSAAKFSKVVVPLMSLAEEAAIAAEVERRLSVADAAETEVEHGLKRAARLRQAILKRAFEGKLVPQDPGEVQVDATPASIKPRAPRETRGRLKRLQPAARTKRRHRRGIAFDRGAVMAYMVHRLGKSRNFGRTEAMKTLYLGEAWLGIDLELEPVREKLGPLDNAIYKVENLARKQGWFTATAAGPMIRYDEGPNIAGRLSAAKRIIGDKLPDFERLLGEIGKMGTDQAELFATTFAAWNDLLLDQKSATADAVVDEVHGWHPTKVEKFPADRIARCIGWMKSHGFVPKGSEPRSVLTEASG